VQHVFAKGRPARILRAGYEGEEDHYKYKDRVVVLAEMLLNFAGIPGFEERLQDLRNADIESVIAELEGAKLLALSGLLFRFVVRSGVRGADYDIEVTIRDLRVPCEMKCKVEDTQFSVTSLKNSLKSARTQFPPDRPGIVFVKIPEAWVDEPSMLDAARGAIGEFLRNTGRVAMVVIHLEFWVYQPDGATRFTLFRTHVNPKARAEIGKLADLIKAHVERSCDWRNLQEIVCTGE
jgi:hypothetical protein